MMQQTEEQIAEAREKLKLDMESPPPTEEPCNYVPSKINWIESADTWKKVKDKNFDEMSHFVRLFILAHYNDEVEGKPQLIHQTIQRIPMLRKIERVEQGPKPNDFKIITEYKFIDDRYDKRYDGKEVGCLAFDFWVYRLVDNGKEYYMLSQNKLSEEHSKIIGMKINLDDLSELSNNLKIKKISSIFIVKEAKPSICVLPKDKLIEMTKSNGWDKNSFLDYLFLNQDGKIYDYPPDFNLLRAAQLLSGKYEGYPLHMFKMGPVGTGKTTEAETLDLKFQESQGILEAGTSRMKVLVPSFKEKPANLGYICNCNRIALVDELMKMVAATYFDAHQNTSISSYLGELNMLLEQKKRMVGSGNDNSTIVKSTAKVCITTNPIPGKFNLQSHLNLIDQTTLSRMLIWVQDLEESEMIYKKENIRNLDSCTINRITYEGKFPEHRANPPDTVSRDVNFLYTIETVFGGINNQFLTIYDSCQQFLVNYDENKIREIFKDSINLLSESFKPLWKSRGLHHSILLLDGITKFRCLFRDYDSTFTPKEEDYETLKKLITHMIRTWDTNLNNDWKERFN